MVINQAPLDGVENKTEDEIIRVENEYWAEMAQALVRLETGKPQPDDFKKVILEGYFKDKAINGVSLLAVDHIKRNNLRSEVMEQLIAISQLEDYFATIKNLGLTPSESDFDNIEE
jgi:hypothetical protein